ncbi:MAG TPA: T9SS type A sorting domain-containing protein, partial [Rhodothermia bacterium]
GPQLPVELASFDYVIDDENRIRLSWTTASESDNAGFELQHAVSMRFDGSDVAPHEAPLLEWTVVDFIAGAGTTTQPQSYGYVVGPQDPGLHRFRLKQIDLDGAFQFSPQIEVTIEVPRELMLSPNYPNPFNPSTRFTFSVPSEGLAVVDVYNVLGQHVRRLFDQRAEPGRLYRLTFDADRLSTGDYVAVLRFNGRQIVRRMVLLR